MLYLFFSVNPCLIDRFYHTFLLNMLYGCIIIYDYKIEGKKERKKEKKKEIKNEIQQLITGIVPLKGHICTLFTPKINLINLC